MNEEMTNLSTKNPNVNRFSFIRTSLYSLIHYKLVGTIYISPPTLFIDSAL